ncbi:hypothetical protein T11_10830, partial [Trichinella zimbabwensis]
MTNRVVTECQLYNLKYNGLNNKSNLHLGRKPSKTITFKTFRKTLFHTKRENSKSYSHEISKFLKILLLFRDDVNWSEKIRNHEWTWSHVARL